MSPDQQPVDESDDKADHGTINPSPSRPKLYNHSPCASAAEC